MFTKCPTCGKNATETGYCESCNFDIKILSCLTFERREISPEELEMNFSNKEVCRERINYLININKIKVNENLKLELVK